MAQEQVLDTRHMSMPEPLLAVLAALDVLPAGVTLRLITERDPLLLYPLLDVRGFRWTRLGGDAGGWQVLIRHTGDRAAGDAGTPGQP
jgi:uncharacterized protein (DUF2249 family)